MARRKKHSEIEEKVFRAWDHIVFPGGRYADLSVSKERERLLGPEWNAALAMAYDGGEWKVGSRIASMITSSRWSNAYALDDFSRAQEEAERCLQHPEPFERHDKAHLLVLLQIARLGQDVDGDAAQELEKLIDCGIYRPGEMARDILRNLLFFIDHVDLAAYAPVSDSLRSLACALGRARKSTKRALRACEQVRNWGALEWALLDVGGYEVPSSIIDS